MPTGTLAHAESQNSAPSVKLPAAPPWFFCDAIGVARRCPSPGFADESPISTPPSDRAYTHRRMRPGTKPAAGRVLPTAIARCLFALGALAFTPGCTWLLGLEQTAPSAVAGQPEAGGDAIVKGPALGCVNDPPPARGVGTASVKYQFTEIVTDKVPTNVQLKRCAKLDVQCAGGVPMPSALNAQGEVFLDFPYGFDGFVEVTADGTFPGLVFNARPVDAETPNGQVPLIPTTYASVLASAAGVTLDTQKAHLLIRAWDCNWDFAAGIQFKSGAGGVVRYLNNMVPSQTLDRTMSTGDGAILNLDRDGFVTLGVVDPASGNEVWAREVVTRAGSITYVAAQIRL
jgi:hypothetical protein